jgi:hypothetical protein
MFLSVFVGHAGAASVALFFLGHIPAHRSDE